MTSASSRPGDNPVTNDNAIVIQRPQDSPRQLILLFHGVGGQPDSMVWLGGQLALEFPEAMVVAVAAPLRSEVALGYQWFSVVGITEENRPDRVKHALPAFEACVTQWQHESGLDAEATALVGFSQGALMSLEACKRDKPLAGRVVAIGGRFAVLPDAYPEAVSVHLLHGKADTVMPYSHTVEATHRLRALGCDVTAEVLPFVGHEIHPDLAELAITLLKTHIPQHVWTRAQQADPS